MIEKIKIPKQIEEVIKKFDTSEQLFSQHDVERELKSARQSLLEPSDAENLGAWAEVLAFALTDSRHHSSPWGTYFSPMGSGTTQEGKTVYFPDIEGTDPIVVTHWEQRANSIKHPVLKARYADLVWDMSRVIANVKPELGMAQIAIDSYLELLRSGNSSDLYEKFEPSLRALDLAIMINDEGRRDAARAALLALHDDAVIEGKGPWRIAFDRLIDEKRAGVTEEEREKLISDLEAIVVLKSDSSIPEKFDPHAVEDASKRLIKYYVKQGLGSEAKRLNEIIGKTFEASASLADPMLAATFLQTAINAYRDAGLREESSNTRVSMEKMIAQSHDQMKPITFESNIEKEDMEKFLDSVVLDTIGNTFARIASEFLQRRDHLEQQVQKNAKDTPLLSMISQSIMADSHVAAKVGSVEEDPLGRLIQLATQYESFAEPWLSRSLIKAIAVHDIEPGHFAGWAARTGLFKDLTLLMEGVVAWYEQDYVKAIHVLVPQIEVGLRCLAGNLGKPTTKPHPTVAGVSVAIGMGDILYSKEVTDLLGRDITLHLLTIYADPRGFNLRNDLAHGLMSAGSMNFILASKVIHTLLVLGIWNDLAEARKADASKETNPKAPGSGSTALTP